MIIPCDRITHDASSDRSSTPLATSLVSNSRPYTSPNARSAALWDAWMICWNRPSAVQFVQSSRVYWYPLLITIDCLPQSVAGPNMTLVTHLVTVQPIFLDIVLGKLSDCPSGSFQSLLSFPANKVPPQISEIFWLLAAYSPKQAYLMVKL